MSHVICCARKLGPEIALIFDVTNSLRGNIYMYFFRYYRTHFITLNNGKRELIDKSK